MEQVASKCYLGLVIQEVIKQLGLQKMTKKIYDAYFQAFKSHYASLRGSYNQLSKADGKLYQHFQYPIGQKQNLQYYLAYGDMTIHLPSIKSAPYFKNNTHSSMLQGFSTNEGAKAKAVRRQRKDTSKNSNANGRKRKNI